MDFSNINAPSKSLFDSDFNKWKTELENFIAYVDSDLLILITHQRYKLPSLKRTMTYDERKIYDNNKRVYGMITKCLPQELVHYYRNQATAYDLWEALLISFDEQNQSKLSSPDEEIEETLIKEEELQNCASVAPLQEFDSNASKCLSCMKLTDTVNRYREDTERLNSDLKNLMEANEILKENEKVSDKKLKAVFEETKEYKAKIFEQQDEIGSYVDMLTFVKKELADSQAEVLDLKRKLSNFSTSSLVFDEILQKQRTDTKSKAGLGFYHVPPPMDYLPMPSKDSIKNFVPTTSTVDTKSVNPSVNEPIKKAEFVRPTFVKAESKPPVSVKEVVEVEDIPEESTIKVEKINVKPENFIITTENDERFKSKGKAKVDNESLQVKNVKKDFKSKSSDNSQSPVKNLQKDKIVDRAENNQCSTSTNSTSGTSTSTCSPKSACSTNVPVNRPSVYIPPPKRFEGTHWNNTFVERRSCFRCGQQGHIIRDCKLISLDRFGRGMPRTSSFRNSFSKSFSRRGSYSPVSSCASNSPKPTARVNKVVPSRPQVQQHNIVENKSSEPKQVWKPKSTNNTSMKSTEFLKYHKLMDVMIMDDSGQPKSIKAWVSHKY